MSGTAQEALELRVEQAAGVSDAFASLRAEAASAWRALGLPTQRHEDWRFTSLRALDERALDAPSDDASCDESLLREEIGALDGPVVVFVDGIARPELSRGSLPAGVEIHSLRALRANDPQRLLGALGACVDPKTRALWALNSACLDDGALVEIAAGAEVGEPLRLLFAHSGAAVAAQPRVLIRAGARSRACVVEHFVSPESTATFCNALTEIELAAGAHVEHVSVQTHGEGAIHVAGIATRQDEASELRTHSIALGASLARVDLHSALEGARAHVHQGGLYLAGDRRHVDHHTTIDHAVADTTSEELYKGILDDRGHGVFHGRIHVRPDAQRIDARQTNRALLLSDRARINTKPQLEIYADDVKCSHGATIGQLDEKQLFYLRSRGIPEAQARAMLTYAFASEAVQRIEHDAVRAWIETREQDWMPGETPK